MSDAKKKYKDSSNIQFAVTNECLATRCEICHLSDLYDATHNHCARCSEIPITELVTKFEDERVDEIDDYMVVVETDEPVFEPHKSWVIYIAFSLGTLNTLSLLLYHPIGNSFLTFQDIGTLICLFIGFTSFVLAKNPHRAFVYFISFMLAALMPTIFTILLHISNSYIH